MFQLRSRVIFQVVEQKVQVLTICTWLQYLCMCTLPLMYVVMFQLCSDIIIITCQQHMSQTELTWIFGCFLRQNNMSRHIKESFKHDVTPSVTSVPSSLLYIYKLIHLFHRLNAFYRWVNWDCANRTNTDRLLVFFLSNYMHVYLLFTCMCLRMKLSFPRGLSSIICHYMWCELNQSPMTL